MARFGSSSAATSAATIRCTGRPIASKTRLQLAQRFLTGADHDVVDRAGPFGSPCPIWIMQTSTQSIFRYCTELEHVHLPCFQARFGEIQPVVLPAVADLAVFALQQKHLFAGRRMWLSLMGRYRAGFRCSDQCPIPFQKQFEYSRARVAALVVMVFATHEARCRLAPSPPPCYPAVWWLRWCRL